MPGAKETGEKIFETALDLFRSEGFDSTTMRDVARSANVATGAAYYYYPSKEAIVLEFYRRASDAMQPNIDTALAGTRSLESRLRQVISVKLDHFAPNRSVLRALLRNGADPKHPLSPFGAETRHIRETDIRWFRRILTGCGIRIPRDLEPALPRILWFYQMGIIFFWVIDESSDQARTAKLLELSAKIVASLIRFSSLPLMRPLRKTVLQMIELVADTGDETHAS